MGVIARHRKPCEESPDTIVRKKQKVEVSTDYIGVVTYTTIERLTKNRFGGYEFVETGAGTIERE